MTMDNLAIEFADRLNLMKQWNIEDGDEGTFRDLFTAITEVMLERAIPIEVIDKEIRMATDEEMMAVSQGVLQFIAQWIDRLNEQA